MATTLANVDGLAGFDFGEGHIKSLTGWDQATYNNHRIVISSWVPTWRGHQLFIASTDGRNAAYNANGLTFVRQMIANNAITWNDDSWCVPNGPPNQRAACREEFYKRWLFKLKTMDDTNNRKKVNRKGNSSKAVLTTAAPLPPKPTPIQSPLVPSNSTLPLTADRIRALAAALPPEDQPLPSVGETPVPIKSELDQSPEIEFMGTRTLSLPLRSSVPRSQPPSQVPVVPYAQAPRRQIPEGLDFIMDVSDLRVGGWESEIVNSYNITEPEGCGQIHALRGENLKKALAKALFEFNALEHSFSTGWQLVYRDGNNKSFNLFQSGQLQRVVRTELQKNKDLDSIDAVLTPITSLTPSKRSYDDTPDPTGGNNENISPHQSPASKRSKLNDTSPLRPLDPSKLPQQSSSLQASPRMAPGRVVMNNIDRSPASDNNTRTVSPNFDPMEGLQLHNVPTGLSILPLGTTPLGQKSVEKSFKIRPNVSASQSSTPNDVEMTGIIPPVSHHLVQGTSTDYANSSPNAVPSAFVTNDDLPQLQASDPSISKLRNGKVRQRNVFSLSPDPSQSTGSVDGGVTDPVYVNKDGDDESDEEEQVEDPESDSEKVVFNRFTTEDPDEEFVDKDGEDTAMSKKKTSTLCSRTGETSKSVEFVLPDDQGGQSNVPAANTSTPVEDEEQGSWAQRQRLVRAKDSARHLQKDKDTKFFLLPPSWQESEDVISQAVQIKDLEDQEECEKVCGFHAGDGKVTIFNTSSTHVLANPFAEDSESVETSSSKVLDKWTYRNFRDVVRFLKLTDRQDAISLHARWYTNFPGLPGRQPYFFQVFGAVQLLKAIYNHLLAILADDPGTGKSTTAALLSKLALNITENLLHMKKHPELHLPADAQPGQQCPQRDEWPFQCLCEPNNMFFGRARKMMGYTLQIQGLAQFKQPWVDEIFMMHQPSAWNPSSAVLSIAGSEEMTYHACHSTLLTASTVPTEVKEFFKYDGREDLCLISGYFSNPKVVKQDGKPRRFTVDSKTGVLDKARLQYPGHQKQDLPTEDRVRLEDIEYSYGRVARTETIATTPQAWQSPDSLAGRLGGCSTVWAERTVAHPDKSIKKRVKEYYVSNRAKADSMVSAVPSLVLWDEMHMFMGSNSPIKKVLNDMAKAFGRHPGVEDISFLGISGTWANKNAAESLALPSTILEKIHNQLPNNRDTSYVDLHRDNGLLTSENLAKLVKDIADFKVQHHKEYQKKQKLDASLLYTLTSEDVKKVESLEERLTRVVSLVVLQRSMHTTMFGRPLGMEMKVRAWKIKGSKDLLVKVNEPIIGDRVEIKKTMKRRQKGRPEDIETMAQILTNKVVNNHAAGVSHILTDCREVNKKMFDDFKDCLIKKNPVMDVAVEEAKTMADGSIKTSMKQKKFNFDDMSDDQQNQVIPIKFLAKEMNYLGWNKETLWPTAPNAGLRKMYKIALGLLDDHQDSAAIADPTKICAKYQAIGVWVRGVLMGKNVKGDTQAGTLFSENTWILHCLRAWLWDVLSDAQSPWYVGEYARYEILVIDTLGWQKMRPDAVKFANHKNHTEFHEGRAKLNANYQHGHPHHIFQPGWFPHILFAGTILATGISLQRHTNELLCEPFPSPALIDQACNRTNRINSVEPSNVQILCLEGAIRDQLCLATWQGPKEASVARREAAQSMNIDMDQILQDELQRQADEKARREAEDEV